VQLVHITSALRLGTHAGSRSTQKAMNIRLQESIGWVLMVSPHHTAQPAPREARKEGKLCKSQKQRYLQEEKLHVDKMQYFSVTTGRSEECLCTHHCAQSQSKK
jgi:hypothetical protein